MNLKILILLTFATLLTFNSTVSAGPKMYNFNVFLGDGEKRLERPNIVHGHAPISQRRGVGSQAVVASKSLRKPEYPPARTQHKSIISELIGGVWAHDPGEENKESDSWDFNAEIIFNKVRLFDVRNRVLKFLAEPRPLIGGSVNSRGKTHTIYTGLSWANQFQNGLFFNFSLGGTYHTGNLEQATRQCADGEGCALPGNRAFVNAREPTLGSAILFRQGLDLGYRLGSHGVSIHASHISNAGIDNDNDGINFVGLRYSFAIDGKFWN